MWEDALTTESHEGKPHKKQNKTHKSANTGDKISPMMQWQMGSMLHPFVRGHDPGWSQDQQESSIANKPAHVSSIFINLF